MKNKQLYKIKQFMILLFFTFSLFTLTGCESKKDVLEKIELQNHTISNYHKKYDFEKTKLTSDEINSITNNMYSKYLEDTMIVKYINKEEDISTLKERYIKSQTKLEDAIQKDKYIEKTIIELYSFKNKKVYFDNAKYQNNINNFINQAKKYPNQATLINQYLIFMETKRINAEMFFNKTKEYSKKDLINKDYLLACFNLKKEEKELIETKNNFNDILKTLSTGYAIVLSKVEYNVNPTFLYLKYDSYGEPEYIDDNSIFTEIVSFNKYEYQSIESESRNKNGERIYILDKQKVKQYFAEIHKEKFDNNILLKEKIENIEISEDDYLIYKSLLEKNNFNPIIVEMKKIGELNSTNEPTPIKAENHTNTSNGSNAFLWWALMNTNNNSNNNGGGYNQNNEKQQTTYTSGSNGSHSSTINKDKNIFKPNNEKIIDNKDLLKKEVLKTDPNKTYSNQKISDKKVAYKSFAKPIEKPLPTPKIPTNISDKAVSQKFTSKKSGVSYKSFAKPNLSSAKSNISRGGFGGGRSGGSIG
jgi:hypothetical protein